MRQNRYIKQFYTNLVKKIGSTIILMEIIKIFNIQKKLHKISGRTKKIRLIYFNNSLIFNILTLIENKYKMKISSSTVEKIYVAGVEIVIKFYS